MSGMAGTPLPSFQYRWRSALRRDATQAPLLGPLFVAQLGAEVTLVDLRPPAEAGGVLGHVPGCRFVAAGEAMPIGPLVLLDADGQGAAREALRLEIDGRPEVAALAGGLAAWRRFGLATSRAVDVPAAPSMTPSGNATVAAIRAQLSDPAVVRWIQLVAVARLGHISCVDGRDERGVIGAPGGDSGELLLQLAALEELTGTVLDDRAVAAILLARVDAFGSLYLHSDLHALAHLLDSVRVERRLRDAFADVGSVDALVPRIRRLDPGLREALLDLLVDPSNVGCGHLRLVDQHPEEYGVRAGLATALQRAAYRLLWEGSPEIHITALGGEHEESAVLDVRLDEPPWALAHVPLVPPRIAGEQMFVYHSEAVAFLREANVKFLLNAELPVRLPTARADDLRAKLEELAARQLAATLRHLAAGLPVYEATFGVGGSVAVRLASS
jgi:rhodanese-related sulfurtransferase